MANFVSIAQIILAIVVIVLIMLEVRGTSMGGFLGGGGDSPVYRTRRGFEKTLFNVTIVVTVLFFLVSIVNVILSQ